MNSLSKGITLIEIMVAIVMISIIAGVLVSNFPAIKLQLSLTRMSHMLTQDIKTAQNLSGSGHKEKDVNGDPILPKGYGVYINMETMGNKKYIIYADINGDSRYNENVDYIAKEVDLSLQEPGIMIKEIKNANTMLSINFAPPNYKTTISNLIDGYDGVEIVLAIERTPNIIKTIYVNKAGLIEFK